MTDGLPVDLQRIQHIPGELLRSRDLGDQLSAGAQRRWWHNRALHNAYGVVSGLTVAPPQDHAVIVQPGLAYDCFGHELLLVTPHTVALPAGSQPMTLLARYRYRYRERGPSAEAELIWQPTGRIDRSDGVPLAELASAGVLVSPVGSPARPFARPRIGYGATPPDGTPWQPWILPERGQNVLGLQVAIDTSTAGFTQMPCYFGWLQWPQVAATHLPYLFYLSLGFQYVTEPAADRFVFRVLLPLGVPLFRKSAPWPRVPNLRDQEEVLGIARGQRLAVSWLGIQDEVGAAGQPHREGV